MKDRTFEQNTTENKRGSTENRVANRRSRDAGAKLIFDNPILCAQFLRGYTDLEILKNIRPEDIEDISERFDPAAPGSGDGYPVSDRYDRTSVQSRL